MYRILPEKEGRCGDSGLKRYSQIFLVLSYRFCVADCKMYKKETKYIPQNILEILLVIYPLPLKN